MFNAAVSVWIVVSVSWFHAECCLHCYVTHSCVSSVLALAGLQEPEFIYESN